MKYCNTCYNCPCFTYMHNSNMENEVRNFYKNIGSAYYYPCGAIYDKKYLNRYGFEVGASHKCHLSKFIINKKIRYDDFLVKAEVNDN